MHQMRCNSLIYRRHYDIWCWINITRCAVLIPFLPDCITERYNLGLALGLWFYRFQYQTLCLDIFLSTSLHQFRIGSMPLTRLRRICFNALNASYFFLYFPTSSYHESYPSSLDMNAYNTCIKEPVDDSESLTVYLRASFEFPNFAAKILNSSKRSPGITAGVV
jgi:hypothetical protein